jgi:hypothetical protein
LLPAGRKVRHDLAIGVVGHERAVNLKSNFLGRAAEDRRRVEWHRVISERLSHHLLSRELAVGVAGSAAA